MEKIDSTLFDWLTWRNGSPLDLFGVPCRKNTLIANGALLREHTVGWCNGASTLCRPKTKHKGVMFFVKGNHFWFHLRDEEFKAIYGILD